MEMETVVVEVKRPSCVGTLLRGCLLFLAAAVICVFSVGTIADLVGVPFLAEARLENVPGAMKDSLDYEQGKKGPLPQDVVLTPAIESFVAGRGFRQDWGEYRSIKSCIAAAETAGVGRAQTCAFLELVDEVWAEESENESLVSAYGVALMLQELNVTSDRIEIEKVDANGVVCEEDEECLEPTEERCANRNCDAFLKLFDDDLDAVKAFQKRVDEWGIVNEASILPPVGDLSDYLVKVPKFHLLRNLNYGVPFCIDDICGIDVDPGDPPPGDLPPIADGVFVHPVPGGYVSGYRFGPGHPGTDYSGGDMWARAAHNCVVTVAQGGWNSGYGNVVVCAGELSDGTRVCTLYGHGLEIIHNVGDSLSAGDTVFHIGSTGNSTGPHLHFEIRINGQGDWCNGGYRLNPVDVLPPQ